MREWFKGRLSRVFSRPFSRSLVGCRGGNENTWTWGTANDNDDGPRLRARPVIGLMASIGFAALAAVFAFGVAPGLEGSETALADTPFGVTIDATYAGGVLTVSGTYTWPECPSEEKAAGFAIFIDDANPDDPVPGALDGAGVAETMHPVNMTGYVFGCAKSGSWGSDSHSLSSAPQQVCVVLYDVHDDELPPKTGKHSTVGAGTGTNDDNSFNKSGSSKPEDSFSAEACTAPVVPTPTPPTPPTTTAGEQEQPAQPGPASLPLSGGQPPFAGSGSSLAPAIGLMAGGLALAGLSGWGLLGFRRRDLR
jgi:hypothetical protein